MSVSITVSPNGFTPYGKSVEFIEDRSKELIFSGPAETGKTVTSLTKLHALCAKYPKSHALILRKTQKSLYNSVLKTFTEKVLTKSKTVKPYGGKKPEWYDYSHGSRIVLGGMDNPDKVLSSEYDFIYVNQAEELSLEDWEVLTTRVTGRAGNAPYSMLFGDCNPGHKNHWILKRSREKKLKKIDSRHQDNPTLYDQSTGELTEQGIATMGVLDNLSGVRKDRLRWGRWTSAEGMIWGSYNPDIHLINRFEIPNDWTRYRVIDFGTVHPFVCAWYAIDGDGRAYMYREIYMTGRTTSEHADLILELSKGEKIKDTICDHAAGDRLVLKKKGIPNIAAKKQVKVGLDLVEDRFKLQVDGKPRLYILRDSLVETDKELLDASKPICFADEIDGYVWDPKREMPVKEEDDGADCARYLCCHLDLKAKTTMAGSKKRKD